MTDPIRQLIAEQPPGFALKQPFYRDPAIYERDLEQIFMRVWIYAGHVSEIPNPGDFLRFDLADESVIVVRNKQDQIRVLLNVCRHRGSRVCTKAQGHSSRFTCPYHGWTYDLNGNLIAASQLPESIDKADYGLRQIHTEVLHGMIFLNFADQPAPFASVVTDLDECLAPYDLANAKVAYKQNYSIDANWKLAVENYSECYHCAPAHPEYARAHSIAHTPERDGPSFDAVLARAEHCGLSAKYVERMYTDNDEFGNDTCYSRYPLLKGHVTGSKDGKPVAPLLGTIKDYDGGTTDFQVGPVTFALAYCDHVVLYRFVPRGVEACDCEVTWLVRDDAVEGKDYDKDELIWLWDVTTVADKRIIEDNQLGVNSRFYEPGPYSKMEDFTNQIIDWYLGAIK